MRTRLKSQSLTMKISLEGYLRNTDCGLSNQFTMVGGVAETLF